MIFGAARAFVAAIDAAEGQLWLKDPIEEFDPPGPRYRKQARWIERAALFLGLSLALTERVAEQIAQQLGLMGMEHHALRVRFGLSCTLRARGAVLLELLLMLPLDMNLWARLLAAGQLAGVWTAPKLWVPELRQSLRPLSPLLHAMRAPP